MVIKQTPGHPGPCAQPALIGWQKTLTSWFALEQPAACWQRSGFIFMYCEALSGLTGCHCDWRCCANWGRWLRFRHVSHRKGKGDRPAKWGRSRSQTCSILVSVFKSCCPATLFFSSHPCTQTPCPHACGDGSPAGPGFFPVSGAKPRMQNELAGLTEVHCAANGFSVDCSA